MLKMLIRTRSGEYHAELDDSDISTAVWFTANHFTAQINELGDSMFFEMPLDVKEDGERQNVFDIGDIAWWPGVSALCIFYGPTPLSGEDGKPVSKFKCIKIGRIIGDCSTLGETGDRQRITLEQEF
ncbi:MAG: AfsR family transcriptional regulator [archaeon]|nr:AfsR family transcriptional regulator [archaeon]